MVRCLRETECSGVSPRGEIVTETFLKRRGQPRGRVGMACGEGGETVPTPTPTPQGMIQQRPEKQDPRPKEDQNGGSSEPGPCQEWEECPGLAFLGMWIFAH